MVTNNHVVSGGGPFTVTAGAHTYGASLVGRFAPDDLAVVRVAGAKLTPAAFADSSKLDVGDFAIAIGNPLGLRSSVTDGIVSAFRQGVSEGNGVALPLMIQTSAAINPGNSGGALADLEGRVIGIPTLAATDRSSAAPRRPASASRSRATSSGTSRRRSSASATSSTRIAPTSASRSATRTAPASSSRASRRAGRPRRRGSSPAT